MLVSMGSNASGAQISGGSASSRVPKKLAGMMPATVIARLLIISVEPTTDGSAPKRRCHIS